MCVHWCLCVCSSLFCSYYPVINLSTIIHQDKISKQSPGWFPLSYDLYVIKVTNQNWQGTRVKQQIHVWFLICPHVICLRYFSGLCGWNPTQHVFQSDCRLSVRLGFDALGFFQPPLRFDIIPNFIWLQVSFVRGIEEFHFVIFNSTPLLNVLNPKRAGASTLSYWF